MRLPTPHSLRARLLWFLLAAILIIAVAQAFIAYRTARAEADEIFDYHMQQMAQSLRGGMQPGGDAMDDEGYDFVVQVWTAGGLRVFQSTRAPLPRRALGFSDVPARGTVYRVFSMQAGPQVIQVAQDMAARREMAGRLAVRTMGPIAVAAPLLMLIVWWVVSSSLAPVSRVSRQLSRRQADDLDPVAEDGLPQEIRPLVQELNLLLGRVHQAFEAQRHFVADAAHELRSPLAALKLQVEGLRRAADDSTRELAVTRLGAGIDRATRLVEQLLALARHQSTAADGMKAEPVELAELVRLALADVAPQAQARGVDLGLADSVPGSLDGHAEPLRILVRNLLDNAIKYSPPGGTVDASVRRTAEGGLELVVEDSGPGIPEADRERVFDRFHRVPGTGAPGSGLGLAIVKSIADLHGARLVLGRSQRLGGLRVEVGFAAR
ncbi:MAG: HAMP domain-containing protein [Aquabacterium sp.]|jgi:two-component system OmpR family sensor kinase|nr:MAG: HAMP domain-containing protein [Aquabacterium sp.]